MLGSYFGGVECSFADGRGEMFGSSVGRRRIFLHICKRGYVRRLKDGKPHCCLGLGGRYSLSLLPLSQCEET